MLVFPQLATGAAVLYPVTRRNVTRTVVNALGDGSTVVFGDPDAGTREWELQATGLTLNEWTAIDTLFQAVMGRFATFTFLDPFGNLLLRSEEFGGIPRQTGAGIVVGDEGHAQRLGLRRHIRMGQHGARAALHRVGDEARPIGLASRKRREQVTGLDLAAVAGYAGEIFCRHHGDCSFLPGTIRENCGAIMNCCAPG